MTARVLVAGKVSSFHQWTTSSFNRVIFFEGPNKARSLSLADNTITDLFTQTGRGLSVSESGDKAFIATFNDAATSAGPVRISLPLVTAGTVDRAFAPPWIDIPTIGDAGAGNVTQGVHMFGYIVETRTSFVGQPSPQPAGVFSPVSFTVAAGGRALTMSLTVNTPADAAFVHPIMTRIDNPDRWYFVPDAAVAVPGGASGWVVNIAINISDERLADSAEEANDHFDALADSIGGTEAINVSSVASYGKRQVYIANDKAYISDPDDFQFITEAGHVVQTPGKRRIVSAFSLRGNLYLIGPSWTHAVSDNGDLPSTWAEPTEVSGSIGSPAPLGVEWRTAGDYAWITSPAGLYLFTGQYGNRPISYYNTPEWERINWAAPWSVQVRDDYVNQRVHVSAALDANTEASHILTWDYARGLTPEDVDFSLDDFAFGNFSAIGLVQVPDTLETQLWVGPKQLGFIVRSDTTSHVDQNALATSVPAITSLAVVSEYETGYALVRGDKAARLNRFGGIDYSIEGSGEILVSFFGLDRLRQVSVTTDLVDSPGQTWERKFYRIEENMSIRFAVDGVGDHFDLTGLTFYYQPYATNYASN